MKKGVLIIVGILFFILAVGIASSVNNSDNNGKIDEEVNELLNSQDEVSVIVVLEDDYGVLNEYSVSSLNEMDEFEKKKAMVEEQQENVLSDLDLKQEKTLGILEDTDFDFELKRKYSTVNAFSGNVTEDGLEKLKNDPEIKEVYLNGIKYINLDVSVPLINATKTWSLVHNSTNITGKHETVCVIDTGVNYTHPNLGGCTNESFLAGNCSKVIAGYDYANDDDDPMDDHSHGTHVAGTVASNDSTYKGVAPDAKIVALKVCNSGGSCTDANINAGIDWCTNNASKYNISVITISLGDKTTHNTYCNEDNTAPYINTAVGQDILVTVSAGNCDWLGASCTAGPSSPACIENATAIGAVNDADSITYQRGALFELLAPGVGIISTYFNGGFASSSGTSMAAPHAAGAAVLIQQFFKLQNGTSLTPSEIRSALNSTGKLIDDTGNSGYSFSRINIFAAIGALDTIAPNITIINPENNSAKTNLTFIVNISSNEVLANATLEINNTNFTMAGSGLEWNVNVSSLANGTYTYKIYGNDSFGNSDVSETFTVNIDLIPPHWSNNITNISDINNVKKNNVFQFNITWNDTVDLSSFIFSWNDTGNWENITNGSLNGKTQIVSINKTITATRGNVIGYKFYANDSANNFNETVTWIFSIANTPPETPSIVFPSSNLYTSQQPLDINVTAFDADNDTLNISYYINGLLNQTSLTNTTFNASEGHFILNVSTYDGAAVSSNASINFTIDTTRPTV
ncbi:MAG: S8 family serine peptidase, partial [Candidatus Woesearchaeota archaeon]|nr:S8 family serine peptidase [Candidatus Woesearchaeota archaeon]